MMELQAQDNKNSEAGYWLAIFGAFALLYCLTAQHGPAWQDSGMHQLRALNGQFNNPLGLALAHPLLIAVGQPLKWLFGEARLATALNMVSSVAMAVAIANVYLISRILGCGRFAAVCASVMLGVSHTAWWLATITESYCGVCAGLTTELLILYSLIKRPSGLKLCLLAGVNGLGWSLHNFFLLPLPVYLFVTISLLISGRLKARTLAAAICCWLAGAGLFICLIVAEILRSGELIATIRSALFGSMWQNKVLGVTQKSLLRAGLYYLLNFPWLSWLIVLLGLRPLFRGSLAAKNSGDQQLAKKYGRLILAVAAIQILFSVRYEVPDQFMFLLPGFVLLSVTAALGIETLQARFAKGAIIRTLVIVSLVLTPVLYAVTPMALNAAGKSIRPGRTIPYRNENRYWISPWKCGELSAVQLSTRLLNKCGPESILVPGDTLAPPMIFIQKSWPLRSDVLVVWLDEPRFAPGGKPLRHWNQPANADQWLAAANGRDLYVLATHPSPAPKSLIDLAVSLEGELLYRIPASSQSAAPDK